jgi:hypothetical protein
MFCLEPLPLPHSGRSRPARFVGHDGLLASESSTHIRLAWRAHHVPVRSSVHTLVVCTPAVLEMLSVPVIHAAMETMICIVIMHMDAGQTCYA